MMHLVVISPCSDGENLHEHIASKSSDLTGSLAAKDCLFTAMAEFGKVELTKKDTNAHLPFLLSSRLEIVVLQGIS